MPTGPRIRANNVYGTITDNPLTAGATSFNSSELALLPTVSAAHAVITLDPLRQHGEPEIVVVTAHTSSSTVATITRGQYGTVAREHPQGTVWVHAPIDEDVREIVTSVTRPPNPYRGQGIYEIDTDRLVSRNLSDGWQQDGLFFDPPACRLTHSVAQTATTGVELTLSFNTELLDTNGMHSAGNPERITFPITGIYILTATIAWAINNIGNRWVSILLNGTTYLTLQGPLLAVTGDQTILTTTTTRKFTAGDFVICRGFQTSGGNLNINSVSEYTPIFSAVYVGRGNTF